MLLLIFSFWRLDTAITISLGNRICYIDTTRIFRGPMNLVGSGSAILAVVLAVNPTMSPAFCSRYLQSQRLLQHLDITQSWVAWGLGYTK